MARSADDHAPRRSAGWPALPRGWSGLLTAGFAFYAALYFAWQIAGWGGSSHRALISNLAFLPTLGVASLLAFGAARAQRLDAKSHRAWLLIGLAYVCYWVGDVLWLVDESILRQHPFPSLADLFYLAFYVPLLLGLLSFPLTAPSRNSRTRFALDMATVFIGGAMVIWYGVLRPVALANNADLFSALVALAYPVADLVIVLGLIAVLFGRPIGSGRAPLNVLVAGVSVLVLADLLFAYLSLDENYQTGGMTDTLYMVAQFLFALAAYAQIQARPSPADAPESRTIHGGIARWLPYGAVAVGYGLLLVVTHGSLPGPFIVLLWGAVGLTVLVVVRQVLVLRDNARFIMERQSLVAQLEYQAYHDTLTGLPNRALFMERLQQALDAEGVRAVEVAVLFLDLDGFKVVNDSLGHSAGDTILRIIAQRLTHMLPPWVTVARFGGDEFTILLSRLSSPDEALDTAERIRESLSEPLLIHGQEIDIGVSVGVAMNDRLSDAPDTLLREADIALYEAKLQGKRRTVHFEQPMQTRVIDRLRLASDLRRALAQEEFRLYYQPEIELRSRAVHGVEALLRWLHPTRGLIEPDAFIPAAEESGLILPIGRWVLETACRQARAWDALRPDGPPLVMSVNLSARQFAQPELVRQVAGLLHETGLSPSQLQLELTEGLLLASDDETVQTLRALNQLGVRLAIDDFGAGYTSLRYLQRFSVDLLKIDRVFVRGLGKEPRAATIVRILTAAAHALDMDVTVEGIETAEQASEALSAGCDRGQGFYFAEPRPTEDVTRLLDPLYRAVIEATVPAREP